MNSARLVIPVSFSPNLDSSKSQLTVQLNGQTIHAVALNPVQGMSTTLEFDVDPNLFLRDNNLVFKLSAQRKGEGAVCSDDETIWAEVSNRAEMHLSMTQLTVFPDLKNLPMPFFDRRDASRLDLPFAFLSRPSDGMVQSAAIVASYWGVEASYRGARFPVHFYELPNENAVVFITEQEQAEFLGIQSIDGAGLAMVENPISPRHRLLVIMGRNEQELLTASRALSLGANYLAGDIALVQAPVLAERRPYDAPKWIPTDRPITLGELVDADKLQGHGLSPGVLSANLQTAPDLFLSGCRTRPAVEDQLPHTGRTVDRSWQIPPGYPR